MSFQDVRDQMTDTEREKTVLLGTGGFSADGRFLLVRMQHPARLCREFVAANEAVGNVHHGCVDSDVDEFHVATYDNLTPESTWRYNLMAAPS